MSETPDPAFVGTTVLIIEDHADSRDALKQILESFGIQVLEAADAVAALKFLLEQPPDLVLCDLRMPGLDGFALAERVRTNPKLRQLRIVALSGLTSRDDLKRAWQAGFDGYLAKPIDYDAVVAALRRALPTGPEG